MVKKITVFTDGGARGNPGPAAAGAVIKNLAGKPRLICGKYLGHKTNNFAEYSAVLLAFETVVQQETNLNQLEVEVFADSLLVVKQLGGEYRVKNANIRPLFEKVQELTSQFFKVSYQHIPREKNKEADAEVNRILDENQFKD